jgi:signal transduction histidine kinase
MDLSRTPVNLAEALEEILCNTQAEAGRKKIAFNVNIDPSATALADEKAVAQVVDNLLSNAIKFSALGGEVAMEAGEVKNEIVIVVKDNGPGFSPEDLPKLFGRFSRLSARPTGGESSHGLGLSIVKRLVDAMGGQILCQSELGKGAIFTVVVPKAAAAPPPKLTRQDIERALAAP